MWRYHQKPTGVRTLGLVALASAAAVLAVAKKPELFALPTSLARASLDWQRGPSSGRRDRAEEFTTKPAFRDAWARGQRCPVVTDGFYEWKNGFYEWKKLDGKGKLKKRYAIRHDRRRANGDGRFVGEMEIADERRRSFESCGPTKAMAKLHDQLTLGREPPERGRLLGSQRRIRRSNGLSLRHQMLRPAGYSRFV